MFAIIETGGKQYVVKEGDSIKVECLGHPGEDVSLKPLLVSDSGKIIFPQKGKKAEILGNITSLNKEKKVLVFKMKRRKHYKKLIGHRQGYNKLLIKEIKIGEMA